MNGKIKNSFTSYTGSQSNGTRGTLSSEAQMQVKLTLSSTGTLSGSVSQNNNLVTGKLNDTMNVQARLTLPASAGSIIGTNDYNQLINKPSIQNVELIGNKNFPDLNLSILTNMEIERLLT